ncbi:MAG TPA: tetraacyldisaccharide 4'-kinase [Fibrobacteraceae bacterium]|nr:tetraacyldisaccharide 4'-kinase [Fibrobacteraceae bacterium]
MNPRIFWFWAAWIWRIGSLIHKCFLVRQLQYRPPPSLPLLVIGGLRAGGAGKTPVAAAVALHFQRKGLRVGLLCYAVHTHPSTSIRRVDPDEDWRKCSDEAVWLARHTQLPVWCTRNRFAAWESISTTESLDILISDDGLEDPRLRSARCILLDWGETARHILDLIPAGDCRSLREDHTDVEIWKIGDGETVKFVPGPVLNAQGEILQTPCVLLCGVGNPRRVYEDALACGVVVQKRIFLRDHAKCVHKIANRLLHQGYTIVTTEKDLIRMESTVQNHPRLFVLHQRVFLDEPPLGPVPGIKEESAYRQVKETRKSCPGRS